MNNLECSLAPFALWWKEKKEKTMLLGLGDSTGTGCGPTNQCSSVWANCRATNIQWDANCNVANQTGIVYTYDSTCTRGTQPGHCTAATPTTVGQAAPTQPPAQTSTSADLIPGISNTTLMIGAAGLLAVVLLMGKR